MRRALSASLYRMAPYFEIDRPNCSRSKAYFTDPVTASFAAPITAPPSLMRPMFKMFTAILNPFCRSYSRFSTGTKTSLKKIWRVEEPLMPIFFSSGFLVIPGLWPSTMNAVKFSSSSIFAKTIMTSANPPLVIHIFWPFRT